MKKKASRFIMTMAGVVLTLSMLATPVSAEPYKAMDVSNTMLSSSNQKTGKHIKVTKKQIKKLGARKAIQNALTEAQKKATSKKTYVITVAPGTYKLDGSLKVYSNTTLVLEDVTLQGKKGSNIIRTGEGDEAKKGVKGYYYKNIVIQGGILDGKNHSGTIMKIGHASNITIENVTLKNTVDTHIMETAGVKGLAIKNCKFMNQKLTDNHSVLCNEAIQLDILCNKHFSTYRSEVLPTKNVVIEGCTFTNVPRGIGSHTSIINSPMDNIRITDCKFDKIASAAIQGMNWTNCTISDNTITNSPRGIVYYMVLGNGKGSFTASQIAKEGEIKTKISSKYKNLKDNQNIVIMNNKITLNDKDDKYTDYERVAILVSGTDITKTKKYSDGSGNIPVGDYYPSGITIENNEIYSYGHGVRLIDTRNTKVINNNIAFGEISDSSKINYYGIEAMNKSQDIEITNNTIFDAPCNGIYVCKDSSVNTIQSNHIERAGKYGIDIEGSSAESITDNIVAHTGNRGIFVYNSGVVNTISDNSISNTTNSGIQVTTNSTADSVTNNQIDQPGDYGIIFSSNAKGTTICGNVVSGSLKKSIQVAKDSSVENVSTNETE